MRDAVAGGNSPCDLCRFGSLLNHRFSKIGWCCNYRSCRIASSRHSHGHPNHAGLVGSKFHLPSRRHHGVHHLSWRWYAKLSGRCRGQGNRRVAGKRRGAMPNAQPDAFSAARNPHHLLCPCIDGPRVQMGQSALHTYLGCRGDRQQSRVPDISSSQD